MDIFFLGILVSWQIISETGCFLNSTNFPKFLTTMDFRAEMFLSSYREYDNVMCGIKWTMGADAFLWRVIHKTKGKELKAMLSPQSIIPYASVSTIQNKLGKLIGQN